MVVLGKYIVLPIKLILILFQNMLDKILDFIDGIEDILGVLAGTIKNIRKYEKLKNFEKLG